LTTEHFTQALDRMAIEVSAIIHRMSAKRFLGLTLLFIRIVQRLTIAQGDVDVFEVFTRP